MENYLTLPFNLQPPTSNLQSNLACSLSLLALAPLIKHTSVTTMSFTARTVVRRMAHRNIDWYVLQLDLIFCNA